MGRLKVEKPHEAIVVWDKASVQEFLLKEQPETDLETKICNQWKLVPGKHLCKANGKAADQFNPTNWPERPTIRIAVGLGREHFTVEDADKSASARLPDLNARPGERCEQPHGPFTR
jgi:hypothetical protein